MYLTAELFPLEVQHGWMRGTFVPEEYVHIRGYYDLIDFKKPHKIRVLLIRAVETPPHFLKYSLPMCFLKELVH